MFVEMFVEKMKQAYKQMFYIQYLGIGSSKQKQKTSLKVFFIKH
jgi:hypothetical protein